ncbi:MAG: hypothetical protein WA633_23425 [Stellaceae bacterium]
MPNLRHDDDSLMGLLAWLRESRCSHVAMEATGVYWTPVWKILRPRHEPVSDRRSFGRLGRTVPRPERECRQAKIVVPAEGRPLAETMLVQCAWPAKRPKNSYYMAQFYRLQTRRGPQKAICAVAASILTAIYHMLENDTRHHDLGADYFDRRSPEAKAKRLLAQLSRLGFEVTLQPLAAAA